MSTSDKMPDHGGADAVVKAQIATLAHRFWTIHPRELQDKGMTREDFYIRELTALVAAISKPAPVAANASAELQNDLGEMLRALGMPDAAQPKSPHEVFQSAIAEMKRQLTNASAEARLREALEPFVKHYEPWMERLSDEDQMHTFSRHTMGDLRRARKAISAHPHASDCDKQGEHPALKWELSDDTKQRIAEIDDNIRTAAINADNIVAGKLP